MNKDKLYLLFILYFPIYMLFIFITVINYIYYYNWFVITSIIIVSVNGILFGYVYLKFIKSRSGLIDIPLRDISIKNKKINNKIKRGL
tara:strand:+ start:3890 stop:4153 length:264 start_codon:yes stop_codon:yes gene_type:complete